MHHRQKLLNPKHPTRIDAFPQDFLRSHKNFGFGGRPAIQLGKSSCLLTAYFGSSLMRILNSIRPSSDPSLTAEDQEGTVLGYLYLQDPSRSIFLYPDHSIALRH